MKRLIILTAVIICSFNIAAGQEPVFVKGSRVFNAGLGIGTRVLSATYNKLVFPPLSASLEVGLTDNVLEKASIGAGPYIGFLSYKWEYSNWSARYSNTIVGVRGNFHYPFIEKLDTYAGLLIGWDIVNVKETGEPYENYADSSSHMVWSLFAGARYYFRENMAAMAELGYGPSYLNLGLAFSF